MKSPWHRLTPLLLCILVLLLTVQVPAQDAPDPNEAADTPAAATTVAPKRGPEDGPAILRLVWICYQRIRWQLSDGPVWYSLGHLNRTLCFIPEGDAASPHTIHIEAHDVLSFDGFTPKKTTLIERISIRADDPERLKTRTAWGFPTEAAFSWEMEMLPFKKHQALLRMFLHKDPQFWQTLLVHSEADLADTGKTYTEFLGYVMVFELLHDPDLKMTSTYFEPNDPPSIDWLRKRDIKAPWVLGQEKLKIVKGSLKPGAGGIHQFETAVPTESYVDTPPVVQGLPKLPDSGSGFDLKPKDDTDLDNLLK